MADYEAIFGVKELREKPYEGGKPRYDLIYKLTRTVFDASNEGDARFKANERKDRLEYCDTNATLLSLSDKIGLPDPKWPILETN